MRKDRERESKAWRQSNYWYHMYVRVDRTKDWTFGDLTPQFGIVSAEASPNVHLDKPAKLYSATVSLALCSSDSFYIFDCVLSKDCG